jgi:hypothetical protein
LAVSCNAMSFIRIALLLFAFFLVAFIAEGKEPNRGGAPARVSNKPKTKSVPTYEDYVALSLENGWTPSDPIEKLSSTVHKYGQVAFCELC